MKFIPWFGITLFCVLFDVSSTACPSSCSCSDTTVTCNSQQLKSVPLGIPNDTTELHMKNNEINAITEAFRGLNELQTIDISNNGLVALGYAFRHLTMLTYLYLPNNEIRDLQGVFIGLDKLQTLELKNNKIVVIENVFAGLTALRYLNLADNGIMTLDFALMDLKNLIHLDLQSNALKDLRESMEDLESLALINLERNPLVCSCKLKASLLSIDTDVYVAGDCKFGETEERTLMFLIDGDFDTGKWSERPFSDMENRYCPDKNRDKEETRNISKIAGIAGGISGIAFIVLILLVVLCVHKCRTKRGNPHSRFSSPYENPDYEEDEVHYIENRTMRDTSIQPSTSGVNRHTLNTNLKVPEPHGWMKENGTPESPSKQNNTLAVITRPRSPGHQGWMAENGVSESLGNEGNTQTTRPRSPGHQGWMKENGVQEFSVAPPPSGKQENTEASRPKSPGWIVQDPPEKVEKEEETTSL